MRDGMPVYDFKGLGAGDYDPKKDYFWMWFILAGVVGVALTVKYTIRGTTTKTEA